MLSQFLRDRGIRIERVGLLILVLSGRLVMRRVVIQLLQLESMNLLFRREDPCLDSFLACVQVMDVGAEGSLEDRNSELVLVRGM